MLFPLYHYVISLYVKLTSEPPVGWQRALEFRNKYYFDEVLFYLHLIIASVYKRAITKQSSSADITTSQFIDQLSTQCDKTSTLMIVIPSYMKKYLIWEHSLPLSCLLTDKTLFISTELSFANVFPFSIHHLNQQILPNSKWDMKF